MFELIYAKKTGSEIDNKMHAKCGNKSNSLFTPGLVAIFFLAHKLHAYIVAFSRGVHALSRSVLFNRFPQPYNCIAIPRIS